MKNPHAFPRPLGNYPTADGCVYSEHQQGMTLRDYFAAKAMQVGLQSIMESIHEERSLGHPFPEELCQLIAQIAYKQADLMLQQRLKISAPITRPATAE